MSTDMFEASDFEFFTHTSGDTLPAAESSDFFSGFADWGQAGSLPDGDTALADSGPGFANAMLFDEGRGGTTLEALHGGPTDATEQAHMPAPSMTYAGSIPINSSQATPAAHLAETGPTVAGAAQRKVKNSVTTSANGDLNGILGSAAESSSTGNVVMGAKIPLPLPLPTTSSLSAPLSGLTTTSKESMPAPAPLPSCAARHLPLPSPPSSQSNAPPPSKARGVADGQRSSHQHQIDAQALAALLKDSAALMDKAALAASSCDTGSGGVSFRSRGLSMLQRCREEVSLFQSSCSSALSASLDAVKTLAPNPALIESIAGSNATLAGLYAVAPLPHALDALRPKLTDLLDRARALRTAS